MFHTDKFLKGKSPISSIALTHQGVPTCTSSLIEHHNYCTYYHCISFSIFFSLLFSHILHHQWGDIIVWVEAVIMTEMIAEEAEARAEGTEASLGFWKRRKSCFWPRNWDRICCSRVEGTEASLGFWKKAKSYFWPRKLRWNMLLESRRDGGLTRLLEEGKELLLAWELRQNMSLKSGRDRGIVSSWWL